MSGSDKQRIVIAVGLPGSGKSTWFAKRNIAPLSSDQMRLLLSGDEENQQIHAEVFGAIYTLLEIRLRIGERVSYVDATHLKRVHRTPYLEIADRHGADVEALWFDAPLEVCLRRNAERQRRVDEDVLERMAAQLESPAVEEGFCLVTRIEDAG